MAINFDGPTKQITLTTGTVTMSVLDLWSRWVDWFLTGDNSKYGIWFLQIGGNDIDLSAGTSIPVYIFQDSGVSIKPQEADHTLAVTDGVLVLIGGGDPFMDTTGAYTVRVNYQQPVQAIGVASGSGLSTEEAAMLDELHKLQGLDASNPMTVTPTSREAGAVTQTISGDGETTSTVQRT